MRVCVSEPGIVKGNQLGNGGSTASNSVGVML